jgi:hypothetical protein
MSAAPEVTPCDCDGAGAENESNVAESFEFDAAAKHRLISTSSVSATLFSQAATNQLVVRLFCSRTT